MAVSAKGRGGIQLPVWYDQQTFIRSAKGVTRSMGRYSQRMIAQARLVQNALQFTFVFAGARQLTGVNRVFREFDHLMYSVSAKIGTTRDNMSGLDMTIRRVAETSTKTAVEVAEASEKFALLGFTTQQVTDALQSTINASVATGTSIENIAYVAGSVSRALNREFEDINDLLVTTATNSGTTIEEMAVGLKYAQASFKGLGLSAEEAFLIIGQLANVGVRGSVMGTAFRSGLAALARDLDNISDASTWSDLEKQLSKQAATLRKFNFAIEKDSRGNILNFREMLDMLRREKASTGDFIKILGTRAGSYFAALVNATDESSEKLRNALLNYEGTAERVKLEMEKSLKSQWLLTLAKWEELQIAISETPLDALGGKTAAGSELDFTRRLQGTIYYLKENLDSILPVALKVGIALGATGLVLTLGLLATALRMVLAPLVRIPVAFAAIAFRAAKWVLAFGVLKKGIYLLGAAMLKTSVVGISLVAALSLLYMIMSDDLPQDKLQRTIRNNRFELEGLNDQLEKAVIRLQELEKVSREHGRKPGWVGKRADVNDQRQRIQRIRDERKLLKDEIKTAGAELTRMQESGEFVSFTERVESSIGKLVDDAVSYALAAMKKAEAGFEMVTGTIDKAADRMDDAAKKRKLEKYRRENMIDEHGFVDQRMLGDTTGMPWVDPSMEDEPEGRPKNPFFDSEKVTAHASEVSSAMGQLVGVFNDVQKGSRSMANGFVSALTLMAEEGAAYSKRTAKQAKKLHLAMAIWNTASAIMQVWDTGYGHEIPKPAKIGLTAFLVGLGAAQVKKIKETDYSGQAHDGLTSVPRTGTFVLERGERVIKKDQNADLVAFMSRNGAPQSPPVLRMPAGRSRLVYDEDDVAELNYRLQEYWARAPRVMSNSGVV